MKKEKIDLDSLLDRADLTKKEVELLFKEANNLYAKEAWNNAIQFYETINKNLNVLSASEKLRCQLESVANLPI